MTLKLRKEYHSNEKNCGVQMYSTLRTPHNSTQQRVLLIKHLLEDRRNLFMTLTHLGRKSPHLFQQVLDEVLNQQNDLSCH